MWGFLAPSVPVLAEHQGFSTHRPLLQRHFPEHTEPKSINNLLKKLYKRDLSVIVQYIETTVVQTSRPDDLGLNPSSLCDLGQETLPVSDPVPSIFKTRMKIELRISVERTG